VGVQGDWRFTIHGGLRRGFWVPFAPTAVETVPEDREAPRAALESDLVHAAGSELDQQKRLELLLRAGTLTQDPVLEGCSPRVFLFEAAKFGLRFVGDFAHRVLPGPVARWIA